MRVNLLPYLPPYLPTSLPPYLPTSLPPYLPTSLPPYLPTSLPPYRTHALTQFTLFNYIAAHLGHLGRLLKAGFLTAPRRQTTNARRRRRPRGNLTRPRRRRRRRGQRCPHPARHAGGSVRRPPPPRVRGARTQQSTRGSAPRRARRTAHAPGRRRWGRPGPRPARPHTRVAHSLVCAWRTMGPRSRRRRQLRRRLARAL